MIGSPELNDQFVDDFRQLEDEVQRLREELASGPRTPPPADDFELRQARQELASCTTQLTDARTQAENWRRTAEVSQKSLEVLQKQFERATARLRELEDSVGRLQEQIRGKDSQMIEASNRIRKLEDDLLDCQMRLT